MAAEPEIVRGEPDGVGVGGVPPQSPVVALLQNVHVSSVMFTSKQLTIKTIQGDPTYNLICPSSNGSGTLLATTVAP